MKWGGSDVSARSAAFSIPGRKAANWCWRQWSSSKPDSKHSRCFSLENNSTAKLWDETDITLVIISWQSPGKINGGCHIPVESNSRLHQILCCNWVALDDFYTLSFSCISRPTGFWLLALWRVTVTRARAWSTTCDGIEPPITMLLCSNDCIQPGLLLGHGRPSIHKRLKLQLVVQDTLTLQVDKDNNKKTAEDGDM